MDRLSWIDINLEIMGGKPCIRNTRVPVDTIITLANEGYTVDTLLFEYPFLTQTDLIYAKTYLDMVKDADANALKGP